MQHIEDEVLDAREQLVLRTSILKVVEVLIFIGSFLFVIKVIIAMQNPVLSLSLGAIIFLVFLTLGWFLIPTFYVVWWRRNAIKCEKKELKVSAMKSKLGYSLFGFGILSIISWVLGFGNPSFENYSYSGNFNDLFDLLSSIGMIILYTYFFYKTASVFSYKED